MKDYIKFKRFFENNSIPYWEIENDDSTGRRIIPSIFVGSTKFLFHRAGNFKGISYPNITPQYKAKKNGGGT